MRGRVLVEASGTASISAPRRLVPGGVRRSVCTLVARAACCVDSAAFTVPWLNVALRAAAHSPMHIGPKGAFRTVLDLKSLQKLEAPAAAAAGAAPAAPAIERHLLTPAGKALLLALQYCQVWDKAVPVPDFHGFTL